MQQVRRMAFVMTGILLVGLGGALSVCYWVSPTKNETSQLKGTMNTDKAEENSTSKEIRLAVIQSKGEYSVFRPGNRYDNGVHDEYLDNIQSILSRRCVACHSCTSAPCQINLTSYEGVVRGMSKDNPWGKSTSGDEIPRARIDDHYSVAKLRSIGFYDIVKDTGDPVRNAEESIMYLALDNGEQNNFPGTFTEDHVRKLGLYQESEVRQCPVNPVEYTKFKTNYPGYGMPFGCPSVEPEYADLLRNWIRGGAKGPSPAAQASLSSPIQTSHSKKHPKELVIQFENYLNQDALAKQAVARYIYEHAAVWNLHFKQSPGEFYRIVRSRTKAPDKIDLIVTEFFSDAPQDPVKRIYYRLEKLDRVIEMKKHVLWNIDNQTIDQLEKTFFSTNWSLAQLPPYTLNPFEWFQVIPVRARAKFTREHIQQYTQSIARGYICHGQVPPSFLPDYTWFFMLDPDADPSVVEPKLGLLTYADFYIHPREGALHGKSHKDIIFKRQEIYNAAFEQILRKIRPEGLGPEDIWKGDFIYGLRHETSVEFFWGSQKLIPGYTRHISVLSYSDVEKLYYRLGLHFKWWGTNSHKAEAYNYGIYSIIHAEDIFLSLNPDQRQRTELRNHFTSSTGQSLFKSQVDHLKDRRSRFPHGVSYEDITLTLLERVRGGINPEIDHLNNWPIKNFEQKIYPKIENLNQLEAGIRTLTGRRGAFPRYVPNVVHIRFDGQYLYTLFVDREHYHNRIVGLEKKDRNPTGDILKAVKGLVGPFPTCLSILGPPTCQPSSPSWTRWTA